MKILAFERELPGAPAVQVRQFAKKTCTAWEL
jgi:hypothetical protein